MFDSHTDLAGSAESERNNLEDQLCNTAEELMAMMDRSLGKYWEKTPLQDADVLLGVNKVTEHQQKEAIEINRDSKRYNPSPDMVAVLMGVYLDESLTALGDVIEALTKGGKGVVPYRNHKLTQLMQDSLGGTVARSLKYAQRAKKITNTATKSKRSYPASLMGPGFDERKPMPRMPNLHLKVCATLGRILPPASPQRNSLKGMPNRQMPVAFVLATARGASWIQMAAIPCLKLKRSLPGVELGGNAYQAILRRAEDGVGRESVTSSYSISKLIGVDLLFPLVLVLFRKLVNQRVGSYCASLEDARVSVTSTWIGHLPAWGLTSCVHVSKAAVIPCSHSNKLKHHLSFVAIVVTTAMATKHDDGDLHGDVDDGFDDGFDDGDDDRDDDDDEQCDGHDGDEDDAGDDRDAAADDDDIHDDGDDSDNHIELRVVFVRMMMMMTTMMMMMMMTATEEDAMLCLLACLPWCSAMMVTMIRAWTQ
ncbi:Kinesin-like protein FLA10 [Symbiodinium microadriaticum]|uniref:Kinesin-like protein FLA10 n=1 Tax=Symbiodinium microadriaticum TaxID=2951 RepID=A0A1Q9E1N9_SYMMI|nr:Kinesin-like protein FLA10 [Symbiodinium microadriaticum]